MSGIKVLEDELAITEFLRAVHLEFHSAREKFPPPNPTVAAMAEEAGELAKAMLHIREGKSTNWARVWNEAVQLAAMAARCAIEGDMTIDALPSEDNCT